MTTVVPFRTPKINLAPDVMVPVADPHLFNPSDRQVSYNAPADQMFAPLYGPHDPSKPHTYCNTIAGHFEISNMNDFVFHQEHLKHLKDGCPESAEADRRRKRTAEQLLKTAGAKKSRKDDESDNEDRDDRGELAGLLPAPPSAADDIPEEYREFLGGFKEDQSHVDPSRQALVARVGGNALELPGDEEKEGLTVYFEEDERRGKRVARYEAIEPKSIMHIQRLYDYQGRSFMYNPLKESDKPAFLPKSLLHTWRGHNKPISAIRWFPPHGHLIMSCSMDNKIKLWDVMNQRNVIQTYLGHSKAVRDICFDNTGDRFISCGYDRFLRVWDTETGKAISTFTTGKQPFVVKFNPDPARQSIFLAGMGDKKIVQWDLRTSRIVQEYNQHMGAVNSITFIDNNRRFVTTADDKSIRIWEFDIPITIKYLADPNMHSMPTVTAHPSGKYLAFQSMGNEILIYQCQDRFRLQNRKKFRGHVNSGYACQVAFSNDGKFICSGDGDGNVWFWEWKSTRMVKKFRAHDKACTGLLWHPVEQSRVATSGWDNMIKFWD